MKAKTVAWTSSALFVLTLIASSGAFVFLHHEQREIIGAIRADELVMTAVTLGSLEAIETGDLKKANGTMIQRVFVGLTRLEPNREQLDRIQRERLDRLVRRLAAYRQRNPDSFSGQEPWWIERVDGWVAALPAQ
jgi:hypothetical protein